MQNKNVLLIDDGPSHLHLAEIALESHFNFKVIKAIDLKDAIETLSKDDDEEIFMLVAHCTLIKNSLDTDLINIAKYKRFILVLETLEDNSENYKNLKIKLGGNEEFLNLFKAQSGTLTTDKLIDCVAEILSAGSIDAKETIVPSENLKKVKLDYLKKFSHTNYDLFLELSPGKTIQVATKANKDMKSVIEHYEKKDISYFLLSPEDYDDFIEHTKELLKNTETDFIQDFEKIEVSFETLDLAFTVAQDQLKALNISRVHQDFVNNSLETALGQLKKSKDLFQKLKTLLSNEDYVVNHSVLNIYFSSYLLSKLNWSNEQSLRQMIYACFYHDFELRDARLAKLHHPSEAENEEEQNIVKGHTQGAAELIDQLPGLNQDAYKIVLDHHERPDGTGFPQGLQANAIPPMSCVFILSHEIVDFLIEKKFQTQYLASKFQEMEEVWNKGNFKRPFTCAREILLD